MAFIIDDLAPNPKNPRKITAAAKKGLSRSLEKFGDLSGITFNSRSDQLVCGHQRLVELKAMGGEYRDGSVWVGSREYRVRVVDWEEAFEREANVAANNKYITGDWDDTIDEYIKEIQARMSEAEFSELRFDAILDDFESDFSEPDGKPMDDKGDGTRIAEVRFLACAADSVIECLEQLNGVDGVTVNIS